MEVKPTSGKKLAEAIFKDVENFFYSSSRFKINTEFNAQMREHAAYQGSNQNARIRLSKDLCEYSIEDLPSLFFTGLVLCHEVAHYINFHNSYRDENSEDSIAIESRADNLGAIIFMVIITFGNKTTPLIHRFLNTKNGNEYVPYIGTAIGILYRSFLSNNSKKYPPALYRITAVNTGFLSFFNKRIGFLPEKFTLNFLLTILKNSGLNNVYLNNDLTGTAEKIIERIYKIHKEIQEKNPLMINGMKPLYGYFLLPNFQISSEEKTKYKKKLEIMISKFEFFKETGFPGS